MRVFVYLVLTLGCVAVLYAIAALGLFVRS